MKMIKMSLPLPKKNINKTLSKVSPNFYSNLKMSLPLPKKIENIDYQKYLVNNLSSRISRYNNKQNLN